MTNKDKSNDDDDDGVTIKINSSNDNQDQNTNEESNDQDSSEGFEEDYLDDDGTITLDNDEYDGNVRLVGTVHVSSQTKDRVLETIEEESPDVVGIELDQERVYQMFERGADVVEGENVNSEDDGGLRKILREKQMEQLQGEDVLDPGEADMIPATQKAIDIGSDVALIDMSMEQLKDNVKENVFDEEGNMDLDLFDRSFTEVVESIRNLFNTRSEMAEKIQENGFSEVVDKLENSSLSEVKKQMDPIREIAPEVVDAFIDERDQHMAGHLHWLRLNGHDVVGVMGRGHLQGVYQYLQDPEDIKDEYVVKPDWYNYEKIEL